MCLFAYLLVCLSVCCYVVGVRGLVVLLDCRVVVVCLDASLGLLCCCFVV